MLKFMANVKRDEWYELTMMKTLCVSSSVAAAGDWCNVHQADGLVHGTQRRDDV